MVSLTPASLSPAVLGPLSHSGICLPSAAHRLLARSAAASPGPRGGFTLGSRRHWPCSSSSRSHICSWNCNLRRWLGWAGLAGTGRGSGRKALGEARGSWRAGRGCVVGPAARAGWCWSRWALLVAAGPSTQLAQLQQEGSGWSEKVVAGVRGPQPTFPPQGKQLWGFAGSGVSPGYGDSGDLPKVWAQQGPGIACLLAWLGQGCHLPRLSGTPEGSPQLGGTGVRA